MRYVSLFSLAALLTYGCGGSSAGSDGSDSDSSAGGAAAAATTSGTTDGGCDGIPDSSGACFQFCDMENPMCPDGSVCTARKAADQATGDEITVNICQPSAGTPSTSAGNAAGNQSGTSRGADNGDGQVADNGSSSASGEGRGEDEASEGTETGPANSNSSEGGEDGQPAADGMTTMPMPEPEPAVIECEGDPAILTEDAVGGEYGPASRISKLDIPANVGAAFQAGCDTVGNNNGSGLAGLLMFVGDISGLTALDENGNADLLLLLQLEGWAAGEAPPDDMTLNLFLGDSGADASTFTIRRASFEDDDPANDPKLNFNANVDDCVLETDEGSFTLSLPILPDLELGFSLTKAKVKGRVGVGEKGFTMEQTVITGYLTKADILAIVDGISERCEMPNAPDLCAQAGPLLADQAQAEALITLAINGYDTLIEDGVVEGDCGDECNAVSVCLAIESEGVQISGLANE
ncbi:MAG: hypothetical protein VX589_14540 [Myxococcota bacterium]|nr:hypothetical protein [Myxococcota bacterium]